MNNKKLEYLVLTLGLTTILVSMVFSANQGSQIGDLIGQALFVPVLFAALHYGRQSGFVTSALAALIYMIAKTQEGSELNLTTSAGQLIILRAALLGLIGIFISELTARVKYMWAGIISNSLIDPTTNVYSHEYVTHSLARLFNEYQRYETPFSLLFVEPVWAINGSSAAKEKRTAKIAHFLRDNVRLVDEVGNLNDGRLCIILPKTTAAGALTVFSRLDRTFSFHKKTLNLNADLANTILSVPEDAAKIRDLLPRPATTVSA